MVLPLHPSSAPGSCGSLSGARASMLRCPSACGKACSVLRCLRQSMLAVGLQHWKQQCSIVLHRSTGLDGANWVRRGRYREQEGARLMRHKGDVLGHQAFGDAAQDFFDLLRATGGKQPKGAPPSLPRHLLRHPPRHLPPPRHFAVVQPATPRDCRATCRAT